MRVLVGTPCGGGVVSTGYLYSFVTMLGDCIKNKIEPILYTLSQESLLPRGRNHLAQVCMRDKYDKLFFIDADSGWSSDNFLRLVHSPFPIVAGVVPLKTHPIVLNYLPFKEDEKYFKNCLRTPEATIKMKEGYGGQNEIPVAFTGTAFMCIDSQVFYKLSETCAPYQYPNPFNGNTETHWDFFGACPINNTYMSEDWGFCHRAREAGYDIRINVDCPINHVGNYTYRINNKVPVDMAPEALRPLLARLAQADEGELLKVNEFVDKEVIDKGMQTQANVMSPQSQVIKPPQPEGPQA